MLGRKNRLKLKGGANRGFTRKIVDSDFIVKLREIDGLFRAAVIVPKKTAAKAIDRNRIKRLITTAIRELKIDNSEMTITVRKNISGKKMEEVKSRLENIFKKNAN